MKVFITRPIPKKGTEMLRERFDVVINDRDRPATREELIEGVKDADAIVSLLTDRVDDELLDAAPKLKIAANYAVGFDNIDLEACTRHNVMATNTPGVLTPSVADFSIALMLATARRIVESDRFLREGKYRGWGPMLLLGKDFCNKTLGIIGMGRIGYAVAERARKGFGMRIIYHDMSKKDYADELDAEFVDMDTLLRESDYIGLFVSLNEKTRHLISREEFKKMKSTAILINTSRGPVVDEEALADALENNEIWAAGIDVYENEPAVNERLLGMKNVILTPHVASATEEARDGMAVLAAKNVIAALSGEKPDNLLNPDVLNEN